MSQDSDSEREIISPELAALFQEYANASDEDDVARINATRQAVLEEVCKLAQQAIEDNTPFGQDLLLASAAEEAEAAKQWTVARAIYKQQLQKAIEEEHVPQQVRWHLRLSSLSVREGEYQSAFESAQAAAERARTFGVTSLLDMALSQVSAAARRLGHIEDAIAAADEGLAIIQETSLNNISRACLQLQRAHAFVLASETDKAQHDLRDSWQLLHSHAPPEPSPGIQWRVGEWWRVEAKARAICSDWNHAREAWESALDHRQSAISVWRVNGWASEAAIQLCEQEIAELTEEYAAAAERAGDVERAALLRSKDY